MPTTVVDPYTTLANLVEDVVLAEFTDITNLRFVHDRLHESVGVDGNTWSAVSPVFQDTPASDMEQTLRVQFYSPYSVQDVDPFLVVDPREIATKAERLRVALSRELAIATSGVWFFDVIRTEYPPDAMGNNSRFEMTLRAMGQNSALLETIG